MIPQKTGETVHIQQPTAEDTENITVLFVWDKFSASFCWHVCLCRTTAYTYRQAFLHLYNKVKCTLLVLMQRRRLEDKATYISTSMCSADLEL